MSSVTWSIPHKVPLLAVMVAMSFKGVYWSPSPPPRTDEQKKYGKEDLIDRLVKWRVPIAQVKSYFSYIELLV